MTQSVRTTIIMFCSDRVSTRALNQNVFFYTQKYQPDMTTDVRPALHNKTIELL